MDVAFEILDKNAIVEIMKKMKPYEVLSLCETQQKMAHVCGDQNVFRALMKEHYPQFPIDHKNPKEQYGKITRDEGIDYYVRVFQDKETWELSYDDKAYLLEFLPEDVDYAEFTVRGTKIPTGDILWLLVIGQQREDEPQQAQAYSSAEDAMTEGIDIYFREIDPILQDFNYSPFIEWLTSEISKKRNIDFDRVEIVRGEELAVFVYDGHLRYDATEEFLQWGYNADVPVTRRSALRRLESQGYLITDLHGGNEEAYKIAIVKVRVHRSEVEEE